MNDLNRKATKLLFLLKKRLVFLFLFTVLGMSLAGAYTVFFMKPIYSLSTTFLLRDTTRAENTNQSLEDITLFQKLMKTYLEIADLPTVREQTESALALSEEEISQIRSARVTNATDSQILTLEVRATDRELADRYIHEYANRYKDFTAEKFGTDNLQIISEARGSLNPVSPSLWKNLLLAAVASLFISLNYLVIQYVLSDKVDSHEEMADLLEVPVLGLIPVADNKQKKTTRGGR